MRPLLQVDTSRNENDREYVPAHREAKGGKRRPRGALGLIAEKGEPTRKKYMIQPSPATTVKAKDKVKIKVVKAKEKERTKVTKESPVEE